MGKGDKLPFIGEVPLFVAKFHIHQFYTVSGPQQDARFSASGKIRDEAKRALPGVWHLSFPDPL